jgi:hypothetical protein
VETIVRLRLPVCARLASTVLVERPRYAAIYEALLSFKVRSNRLCELVDRPIAHTADRTRRPITGAVLGTPLRNIGGTSS